MFEQSITLLRIRGIPIKLHVSLLLFLPYVTFVATRQFTALATMMGIPLEDIHLPGLAWGVLLAIALFVSILLHELAHSLVAKRSGTEVQSVTLMMLGGVTRLRGDVAPGSEAFMAFVGPMTSLFIALLSYAVFRLVPLPVEVAVGVLVVAWMNFALGLFNLLPAFPMDGGRVLRGLLVKHVGRTRATRIATTIGKWMAGAFALYGLLTFNVLLVLIAGFVYMGSSAEQTRLAAHDALLGVPVADLMSTRLGEAHPGESAGEVARRLLIDHLVGATVVEDPEGGLRPRVLGVVTAADLAQRASHGDWDVPVERAMLTDVPSVHVADDAAKTLDAMVGDEARAVLVLNLSDEVVGLVTDADIQRAMTLASLGSRRS